MYSLLFPVIVANLLATGCALLLLRRSPTRRLKLLTLAIGLMSLSHTASLLQTHGIWTVVDPQAAQMHQSLAACISLLSIYLVGHEIYDRSMVDRKLRLAEHEASTPGRQVKQRDDQQNLHAVSATPAQKPAVKGPVDVRELHQTAIAASGELMRLLVHASADGRNEATLAEAGGKESNPPEPSQKRRTCESCRQITKEMAGAWLELHLGLEVEHAASRLDLAKARLAKALRTRWEHEFQAGHELMQHPFSAQAQTEQETETQAVSG